MKISKLFHWLYAFLMFLPILFIAPNVFYFAFNDNATAQDYTYTSVEYRETNNPSRYTDLVLGNVYTLQIDTTHMNTAHIYPFNIQCEFINIIDGTPIGTGPGDSVNRISSNTSGDFPWEWSVNVVWENTLSYFEDTVVTIDFVYSSLPSNGDGFYGYEEFITACPRLYEVGGGSITITMDITESINQAVNEVFDKPLFSWSKDNFITGAFRFITNLFGMDNNNVVVYFLSYWTCISIVYLVFDIILYLPLLAHNWIDKARIE